MQRRTHGSASLPALGSIISTVHANGSTLTRNKDLVAGSFLGRFLDGSQRASPLALAPPASFRTADLASAVPSTDRASIGRNRYRLVFWPTEPMSQTPSPVHWSTHPDQQTRDRFLYRTKSKESLVHESSTVFCYLSATITVLNRGLPG